MFRFLRGRSRPIPAISPISRRVRDGRLTYLKDEKLVRTERSIDDVSLYDRVVENFEHFGQPVDGRRISLYKGYFEDTLHPPTDIASAHIDCDWYDPVKCAWRESSRASPQVRTSSSTTTTSTVDAGATVDEFLGTGLSVDTSRASRTSSSGAGLLSHKDSPWIEGVA